MTTFFSLLMEKKAELMELLFDHLNMTAIAVLISLCIGVPLGIWIVRRKKMAAVVIGVANIMQSIPCIALLALLVPFVGIGAKPAVIMVIVYALLPIIKNTYTGVHSIDPKMLEAGRGMGLSNRQLLWRVELPLAAPFIMAGVRISAVTAVGTMTIAAFAGAGGLGYFINVGLASLNPSLVLLGAIPASLLALLIDFILGKVERIVTPEGIKPPEQIVHKSKRQRRTEKAVAFTLCGLLVLTPLGYSGVKALGQSQKKVVIGSTNFTEAYILGEVYTQLIEANTDMEVEQRFSLNGATVAFGALEQGDIDMFVEYTGTALMNVLHQPAQNDPDAVYQTVADLMLREHNIVTSQPLGFNNTYVMSVTEQTAQAYNLRTLSDLLRAAPQLRLGCTTEFVQRADCLPHLQEKYGATFASTATMDATVRYQAIASNHVDVIDAFSTDALLEKTKLVTLDDDLQFFPPFYAVNFLRADVLERYPELEPVLSKLDGLIDEETMRAMNYRVDVLGEKSADVARDFLLMHGLIPQ